MKFYKKGDKSKAICDTCGFVHTTFLYRDLIIKETGAKVENVLVGVCDKCGKTVSTPAQSTAEISKVREKSIKSLEVFIPSPFIEALYLAGSFIDGKSNSEKIKNILQLYIHDFNELNIKKVIKDYEDFNLLFITQDLPKKRMSFKISNEIDIQLNSISKKLNKNKTETIKVLVTSIKKDIVDEQNLSKIKELQKSSLICY